MSGANDSEKRLLIKRIPILSNDTEGKCENGQEAWETEVGQHCLTITMVKLGLWMKDEAGK